MFSSRSHGLSCLLKLLSIVFPAVCAHQSLSQSVGVPCNFQRNIATHATTGAINDMTTIGGYVYAAQSDGLSVYSLADPYNPSLASQAGSSYETIFELGNDTILLASENTRDFYNCTNPANPTLVASYPTTTLSGNHYCAIGQFLFEADGSEGVNIYDFSNPNAIQPVGSAEIPEARFVINHNGNLVAQGSGILYICDAALPTMPEVRFQLTFGSPVAEGYSDGNLLHLLRNRDSNSSISSYVISEDFTTTYVANRDYVNDICLYSGDLFAAVRRVGFTSYRLDTDSGSYDTLDLVPTFDTLALIATTGNHTIVSTGSASFDVLSTETPLSSVVGAYDSTHIVYASIFAKSGSAGYAGYSSGRPYVASLDVIDLSDLANPVFLATIDTDESNWIEIRGDLMYVVGNGFFRVFSITEPASPTLLSRTELPDLGRADISHIEIVGNLAYISERGLHVLDVSDPENPVQLGVYAETSAYKAFVHGNYACLASGSDGLVTVDVSDPSNILVVNEYPTSETLWGIELDWPYLYLNQWEDGLLVLDVSDPAQPVEVGSAPVHAGANGHGISKFGSIVYLSSHSSLNMFDVSDPTNPVLIGIHHTPGDAEDVYVEDGVAYIADWRNGFQFVNVSTDCGTPSCLPDTNNDGQLTPTDFTAWIGAFNTNAPECDQNGDGMCTPTDFSAWVGNYNAGCE